MFSVRQEVEIPAVGCRGVLVREIAPAVWRIALVAQLADSPPATADFDESELRRVRRVRPSRTLPAARRQEEA